VPGYFHPEFDPSQTTQLNGDCADENPHAKALPGMGLTGGTVMSAGNRNGKWCEYSTVFWDLTDAKGKNLFVADRIGHMDWWEDAESFGDWNRDGLTDLLVNGGLHLGPLLSYAEDMPDVYDGRSIEDCGHTVEAQVQDMTGDGLPELLLQARCSGSVFHGTWWVLEGGSYHTGEVFSYADPPGVRIGMSDRSDFLFTPISWDNTTSGDLDGDGKAELIHAQFGANDFGGKVYIWRGADLFPD
jgi:hypothetical protein